MINRWHLGCGVFLLALFSQAPSPSAVQLRQAFGELEQGTFLKQDQR